MPQPKSVLPQSMRRQIDPLFKGWIPWDYKIGYPDDEESIALVFVQWESGGPWELAGRAHVELQLIEAEHSWPSQD